MLFITSRLPTINTEPEFNKTFQFNLGDNSSGRKLFCCVRHKKGNYEEIGSKNLMQAIKESNYRQVHACFKNLWGGEILLNTIQKMTIV